jgi:predicted secreted protein|tara:strand:+ start:6072 stop:6326 length:255 start_codon:yes stop_codon:yes gene_type:complete
MTIATGLLLFLIVWWTVIFMILPIGVAPPEHPETGHDPGAPANPNIGRKAVITTVVSALIWLVIYGVIESDLYSFREAVRGFWD